MSESNEQIINDQQSLELEETEFTDTEAEEKAEEPKDDIPMTKKVSERINQKVSEAVAKENAKFQKLQEDYEGQIADYKSKLNEYRAAEKGITVEELEAEDDEESRRIDDIVTNDPRYKALEEADFNRRMNETLKSIQEAFPEENLDNIENLPVDFYKMLQVGTDPVKAYRATVIMDRKEVPPSSGSVKTNDEVVKGSYTREQVASMSQEEVHEHWDEITKSMKNW